MPTITITTQSASQALRGQNVKITVDLGAQSAEFAQLSVGQSCEYNGTNNYYGVIDSIDSFGNSFEITPLQPNLTFGEYGYLISGEAVIVTI